MAIVMFLFGSVLGTVGVLIQWALGFEMSTFLLTYGFCAIGLPLLTLISLLSHRDADADSAAS